MHDTLISKDIIEAAQEQARQEQGRIKGVMIEVGDLGHLPAEELKETLSSMKPDWQIRLTSRKARVRCSCGYEGEPRILEHSHGHSVYTCPECGAVPELVEGGDIVLKEVIVE